ncbi:MAG: oxidoreductase [Planctomycetota bacterium]|nr:MAG: oxidoreductase [Planctomycetota bacterium]
MADPLQVEVAIIGAGIAGAACARWLVAGGATVALIERGEPGRGTTGAGTGLVLTGLADHYNRVARGTGREQARAIWQATIDNAHLIRELIETDGLACGWEPGGVWLLATWPVEAEDLEESLELLHEDGLAAGARWCSARELQAEPLAPRGLGALRFAHDGALDATRLVRGLIQASAALAPERLHLLAGTAVRALRTEREGVRIETAARPVWAQVAVLAVGAEAAALHPFFEGRLLPVRAQGLRTRPLPAVLARGVSATYGHEYYRQLPDGRLYVAGVRPDPEPEEITTELSPTERFQQFLRGFCARRLGYAVSEHEVELAFGLTAGQTADGLPLVGPLPGSPALVACCGFNLRGLSLGVAMGRAIARLVLHGERTFPQSFLPARFL